MSTLVHRIHEYFIPHRYRLDEEVYRKTKILVNTTLITSLFALFFLGNTLFLDMPNIVPVMVLCTIIFVLNAFMLKWGVPKRVVANFYIAVATFSTLWDTYYTGGLNTFNISWLAYSSMCAVMLDTKKSGWVWLGISITGVLVIGGLELSGYPFPSDLQEQGMNILWINAMIGLLLITAVITIVLEDAYRRSRKALKETNVLIEQERHRSEELLLNILPADVMQELKNTGKTTARNYDLVTVMFVDFKDFTIISSDLAPEELVSGIDEYFEAFDHIVTGRGIEKIKTIGDAYLCAAGIPEPNNNNPVQMVDTAFLFLDAVQTLKEERSAAGKVVFDIRVGIHSGPLIAGVVGIRKFAYDIWGDAVNTAARMQQYGEENRINVSGTTYELVKHRFHCTYRGRTEVKHKGALDMYFVDRRRAESKM